MGKPGSGVSTSAPGSISASAAQKSIGLAPGVTTTLSGPARTPRATSDRAIASRSSGTPAGSAYRVSPSRNARTPASTTCGGVGMSGSPISRCTTLCPAASSRRAAASTTEACSVPSVSSRAAACMDALPSDERTPERRSGVRACNLPTTSLTCPTRTGGAGGAGELLGAFQVDALARVDPHLFALTDELRHLDGDAVRELGRLRARGLGSPPHHGRRLHHGQLDYRRQLHPDRPAVRPLDLNVHLRLQPFDVNARGFSVKRVLLVARRVHHMHAAVVAVQDLEFLGLERRLVHEVVGG